MKSFLLALFGAIIGSIAVLVVGLQTEAFISVDPTGDTLGEGKQSDPFLEYYTVENAVSVSPHDLRMEMDKGTNDTIIVDLRSAPEYKKEHIKGAINIPGSAGDLDAKAQRKRIVSEFQKLPKDKRIIIHCYTHYCMLAKHVGLMLAEEGIRVHELNIGWNEWRYEWDLWNGEGTSKEIDITDYLEGEAISRKNTTSSESGSIDFAPCTSDGLAGC